MHPAAQVYACMCFVCFGPLNAFEIVKGVVHGYRYMNTRGTNQYVIFPPSHLARHHGKKNVKPSRLLAPRVADKRTTLSDVATPSNVRQRGPHLLEPYTQDPVLCLQSRLPRLRLHTADAPHGPRRQRSLAAQLFQEIACVYFLGEGEGGE